MKARPILFNGPMVRALLDGGKSQTRRVVKPAPMMVTGRHVEPWAGEPSALMQLLEKSGRRCPYGQPGDRLWVRETHDKIIGQSGGWIETDYRATYTHGDRMGDLIGVKKKWTAAIHIPRDASRITLEIVSVRVERLQDISEADAIAEGCTKNHNGYFWGGPHKVGGLKQMPTATSAYRDLWESINGAGSSWNLNPWDLNPWVWAIEFKKVTS